MGLKSIFLGWYRALKGVRTTQSEKRLKICGKCSYAKSRKILRIINGSENYDDSLQCTICKCPCLEKSLVETEKCPKNKW